MHQYRELTCTDAFLRFISEVQIAQQKYDHSSVFG